MSAPKDTAVVARPAQLFPLVRHLSGICTSFLIRTPMTPNQITAVSLLVGWGAAACLLTGSYLFGLLAAGLMLLCYVLDNCDGEVARFKNLKTRFGRYFDTFVDWAVHAAFFAALGAGTAEATGEVVWAWLGWIAFTGATINYLIGCVEDIRGSESQQSTPDDPAASPAPQTWKEHLIYAFRELSRADFCFIVLALALADGLWLLLPAGAVGAQVYWLTGLVKGAKRYHV